MVCCVGFCVVVVVVVVVFVVVVVDVVIFVVNICANVFIFVCMETAAAESELARGRDEVV